jgi:hypothetical protein
MLEVPHYSKTLANIYQSQTAVIFVATTVRTSVIAKECPDHLVTTGNAHNCMMNTKTEKFYTARSHAYVPIVQSGLPQ